MSWLMTSIANSLKLDQEFGTGQTTIAAATPPTITGESQTSTHNPNDDHAHQIKDTISETPPSKGVKNDLTEISKTLTRQFWGVASFLAPPPQIAELSDDSDAEIADQVGITGIRNDLSEIGGRFRTGITKLSSNKAVSGFTKIASNLLQFGSEEDVSVEEYAKRGVVGVTEEVVAFATDVAQHPKTWLAFPFPHDNDDDDDESEFDMSKAQQEHVLAVERLAPELGALKTELCLAYMSEACFWKIYFVLVHPRLSRRDAEILSTPEIVRARAMLTQDLHSGGKLRFFESGTGNASSDSTNLSHDEHKVEPIAVEASAAKPVLSIEADIKVDKHPVTSTEIPVIDKRVIEEESIKQRNIEEVKLHTSGRIDIKDEDDNDDWLKEENTEEDAVKRTSYPMGNDDDISFSDLEDDEELPSDSIMAPKMRR